MIAAWGFDHQKVRELRDESTYSSAMIPVMVKR